MLLFGDDLLIGDFKLSDYGLKLASFESDVGNREEELGMDYETIEEYIGNSGVPTYLGSKYTNKLNPSATIVKENIHNNQTNYFTEHECREVLRQLTGFYGYRQMQIYSNEYDELLYFNVKITNVSYKKVAGNVIGIILDMECDSQFAWSKEFNYIYDVTAGQTISFYNVSDDLYNYLKPTVVITANKNIEQLEIVNLSDSNWTTVIDDISNGETITMDSKNEILESSNKDRIILNDFNLHFIRFVSGINKIKVNSDCKIEISFRTPIKVGLI